MPRNGQSMLFTRGAGASYIQTTVSITNTSIFPTAFSQEEATKFGEVRSLLAQTLTRIIQRDHDTTAVLTHIADGRGKLNDILKEMN